MDQPSPPAAEALDAGVVDGRLELVHPLERRLDRLGQSAAGLAPAAGLHDLPEHAVVGVAAAVVAHSRALVLRNQVEDAQHLLDWAVRPLGALERGVDVIDVRAVMLVVVNAHRLLVDRGLERVVGVRERGQLVGHQSSIGSSRCLGRFGANPTPSPLGGARGR